MFTQDRTNVAGGAGGQVDNRAHRRVPETERSKKAQITQSALPQASL